MRWILTEQAYARAAFGASTGICCTVCLADVGGAIGDTAVGTMVVVQFLTLVFELGTDVSSQVATDIFVGDVLAAATGWIQALVGGGASE